MTPRTKSDGRVVEAPGVGHLPVQFFLTPIITSSPSDPEHLAVLVEPWLQRAPRIRLDMWVDTQNQYEVVSGMEAKAAIIHLHATCASLHRRAKEASRAFRRLGRCIGATFLLSLVAGTARAFLGPQPPISRFSRSAARLTFGLTLLYGIFGGCLRDRAWWRASRYEYISIGPGSLDGVVDMEEGRVASPTEHFLIQRRLCV